MLWFVQATASALEDGSLAYERGDYAEAARLWRPLAKAGDADAQFALGTLYQQGRGVEHDDARATRWFRRAAEQGSVPAQYNLGNAYKFGRGVKADDKMAFQWWEKAAQAGLAPAQFNLGTAYLHGRGVTQSTEQGIAWYREAAANGHPGARAVLERLAAQVASAAGAEGSQVFGPDWIRNQPPEHYTMQLLAAESDAAARRFIASLPDGEYALAPYHSRNKRWVAVVSGSFETEAEARQEAARRRLPVRPWVRQFATLRSHLTE